MKKKFLLAFSLVALLIVIFAISVSAAEPVETWDISATSSDNVTAYLYTDPQNSGMYTLTISGTGNMKNRSWDSSPWYSSYSSNITSVTIEKGVTSIGSYAFSGCSSLTSIVIPEGVTSIGSSAFQWCSRLANIIVNESNQAYKSIDGNLYSYDVKTLIQYAVGKSNEAFTIPEAVTSIGNGAFLGCSNLASIVIPEGVTSIGNYAFDGCSSLTSIAIPEGVTSIGDGVFLGCSNLASIVIPEGVTSIGYRTFYGCSNLASIAIPDSVTSIGYWAFLYCSKLTIYAEAESQPSGWDTDWNPDSRPVVWGHSHSYDSETDLCVCGTKHNYVEKWNISATSSDSVAAYLFADPQNSGMYTLTISGTGNMKDWGYGKAPWYSSYSSRITSVTIEEGVTSIGDYAFDGCFRLTSIVIPDSVSSIGDDAFRECDSLTSIVIPEGVTSIGSSAFQWCCHLTSIVIPEGVTSIGDYAFSHCSSLTIYCEATSQPSGWATDWNSSNCPVVWGHTHTYDNKTDICICGKKVSYVEKWDSSATSSDSVTAYLCADPQNSGMYTLKISGTGEMKNWGDREAPWYSSYRFKITSVTIEKGVTSIGNDAFSDCRSLTSIVIPDGVTSIGEWAFYYCSSLTSIVIPEGVTSIGYGAFCECVNLTSIVIPDSVTSIGNYAFQWCSSLTSIVIPDSVTSIGICAFCECSSLTSIVIPESVTSIGGSAFSSCSSLTSIVIPEGVTSIGYGAFSHCSSLTSIVIPEGVTSIGSVAFSGCSSLTIYCEATSQPSGWDTDWNSSNRPVVWGYFDEEACLNAIFTFKGYSFNESGSMAVGFDIDYKALAKYEEKTGKTLEIGVVFAGYDSLNGSAPLDQAGNEISVENGFVVKFDITPYNYLSYDFVITDIDEAMADTALVISAYIYNGENVKYEQENGLSDTVTGISYNQAQTK